MAFRELGMVNVKEILRRWIGGAQKKKIATDLRCDPKTVRRYIAAAEAIGMAPNDTDLIITDENLARVMVQVRPSRPQEHGEGWQACVAHRSFIVEHIEAKVRLSKIRRLLHRRGVNVTYSTLHRFAYAELNYGKHATTVPMTDGQPGSELQVDTGWVISITDLNTGCRRRMKAWIFTPVVSRYRFVHPCETETTTSAIAACEAAWQFYGGIFSVLIPDNTKAIVNKADPLGAQINETFLEYSQCRNFVIDPTRVRRPKDKARVERSVRDVRDDCYGGEVITNLEQAHQRALTWCTQEYGLRIHSTTRRRPKEHFENDEMGYLQASPMQTYDVPVWTNARVGNDQFAVVLQSFYSLPPELRGHVLRARVDSQTVRFYNKSFLLRVHVRMEPGKKVIEASDFPTYALAYGKRDVAYFENQAREHSANIGDYAHAILSGPLPWTRMRQVNALLGMVKKYGVERVDQVCKMALAADMHDVRRLRRMIEIAIVPPVSPSPTAKVIPIAKYLRAPSQYAAPSRPHDEKEKKEKHE